MSPLSRRIAIGAVLAALVIGVVGAHAYWTTGGSGAGSATAGAATNNLTLTPGTATTSLYPATSGDVALSIANGNPYVALVGSLALDTGRGTNGVSVDGGHSGCDVAALSYTTQTNGGAGWFVPAGSTLSLDLANAVSLGTGADSACQGATFTLFLLAAP